MVPAGVQGDARAAYQNAAGAVAELELAATKAGAPERRRRPGSPIPAEAFRVGLKVAERNNPLRTGRVLGIRDIAINPDGPEFRFALVELDGVKVFGQSVQRLYLFDALRYPAG